LLLPSPEGEGMNDLLSNDNIGRDVSVLNESSLRVINIVGEVRLKSVSQRFGNNFVNDIA
jgi:hypothetical protein